MTGVINDIGYINTEGTRTAFINDTCHAVLVPSVLMYPMLLMTPVMLSWFLLVLVYPISDRCH
jgi:hypothetical protein